MVETAHHVPLFSWPESILSAGDERQSGAHRKNATQELGAASEPQQAAPVLTTVLHVPSAPGTALVPASLSKRPSPWPEGAHRAFHGRDSPCHLPVPGLVPAEPAQGTPQGLLSLAGDMHPLHKSQRDPSDLKGALPPFKLGYIFPQAPSQKQTLGLALWMQLTL